MKHDEAVREAAFTKDEQRILTWSEDGTARLWDIGADYDFPANLIPLLIEAVTGTAMDDFGNLRALNSHDWTETNKTYLKLAEKHLQTCDYKMANLYTSQKPLWDARDK